MSRLPLWIVLVLGGAFLLPALPATAQEDEGPPTRRDHVVAPAPAPAPLPEPSVAVPAPDIAPAPLPEPSVPVPVMDIAPELPPLPEPSIAVPAPDIAPAPAPQPEPSIAVPAPKAAPAPAPAPLPEPSIAVPAPDIAPAPAPSVAVPTPKAAPAPTKQDRIAKLLREGQGFLAAKQLTTPQDRSALGRFREVLKLDPGNAEAKGGISKIVETYKDWGIKAVKDGDHAKAIKYAERAGGIDPADPDVPDLLGTAYLGASEWQKAIDFFLIAVKLDPERKVYKSIGAAYFQLEKYPEAIAAMEQAAKDNPNDPWNLEFLGLAYEEVENWGQAAKAYRRAYDFTTDRRPNLALALGRVYTNMTDYKSAVPFLEEAKKHSPDSIQVHDNLATAYHNLGDQKRALAAVKTRNRLEGQAAAPGTGASSPTVAAPSAETFSPTMDDARKALGEGHYASAYFWYKELAEKGDAEAAYMLGRMYHQGMGINRDLPKALMWYQRAADAGHAAGQAGVGYMYYRGLGGVPVNHAQAARWFQLAADQGLPSAMARLGHMSEYGQGVAKSSKTASYWYVMAAVAGDPSARKRLTELGTWPMDPNSGVEIAPAIGPGLGEMPPLSVTGSYGARSGEALGTVPAASPPPQPSQPSGSGECSGLAGALGCAGF